MSIKDLFERSKNYIADTNERDVFSDAESSRNVNAIVEKQNTFEPQIDYNEPSSFTKFGSAELYYQSAIDRIIDFYPYDGSDAEYNEFFNKSLDIEKFIFNNLYPRTNGYVNFSSSSISLKGGPHTINAANTKGLFKNPNSSQREAANIYDEDLYKTAGLPSDYGDGTRESNLKCDFAKGVTLEFWLKSDELPAQKQDIFHLKNTAGGDELSIFLDGNVGASTSPFKISLSASSAMKFQNEVIGATPTKTTISDWNHYAISLINSDTKVKLRFYLNGVLDFEKELGSSTLSTFDQSGTTAEIAGGVSGHFNLSGSMDEFRFWKIERTAQDIGRNWFGQVRGGTNTDINNTTLGVYYKFNEGITGIAAQDSVVLDYSGRISNGTFNSYTSNSRNTGSAIVSASAATKEYLDPIIYANHPDVSSLRTSLLSKGIDFDYRNGSSFSSFLPSWIFEQHEELNNKNFKKLSHIIGAYFDKIYLQIEALPTFKTPLYTSSSYKPLPFASHLPSSLGIQTPDLFLDSTVLEKFINRDDTKNFEFDLDEVKNLIYLNLYNNLTYLYKSKGTHKAVKNVLRTFNIDDKLVRFNTYANNYVYELENNLQQTLLKKSSINFNTRENVGGVVYSTGSHSTTELGYISGSDKTVHELNYGLTHEVDVFFPRYLNSIDKVERNFKRVSLFGIHSASKDEPALIVHDPSIYVYAQRDELKSKNVKFFVSSSLISTAPSTISSSNFLNVYDDENWNLSVRLRPTTIGLTGSVEGVTATDYTLEFTGYNQRLGEIKNTFKVTSSVNTTDAAKLLKSSKRIFLGAHRTNVTGNIQHVSDVLISSTRYWTQYINDQTLQQHALDFENFGIVSASQHLSPLDVENKSTLNRNTLALNYEFGNVTTSDSSGEFTVTDVSSGSVSDRYRFGKLGEISSYLYPAKGFGFKQDSTDVVLKKEMNVHQFTNPELAIGDNLVQIKTDDDKLFDTVDTIPNYHYILEKSMYAAISEEMLNFFAGVNDFNNLIGHPVHQYRMNYKGLEKLREVFFRRVTNVSDVEKFVNYYKWFDDALSEIIAQLVPASADYTADVLNTIESHVLERNKYQHRLPMMAFTSSTEGVAFGSEELQYDWNRNHAPISGIERENSSWWRQRAERGGVISSGDATVDSQRKQIKLVQYNNTNGGAGRAFTQTGQKYSISDFKYRTISKPFIFKNEISKEIKGGVNFDSNKDIHFTYTTLHPAGPISTEDNVLVPQNVLLGFVDDLVALQDSVDPPKNPHAKVKRNILVQHGRDYEDGIGYKNRKSSFSFPFNIISSSVTTGFNSKVVELVTASVEITNLHNDVYGPDMERPMQGTFTEHVVGGHQSRHIKLNTGADDYLSRPEAWKILLGANCNDLTGAIGMVGADYPWPEANDIGFAPYPLTGAQKAVYFRDELAKRPVNIRNIRHTTGSTVLGNYNENYQVVHSVGAFANPRAFIDQQPAIPPKAAGADVVRTILDFDSREDGKFKFIDDYNAGYLTGSGNYKNKTIIRSRFSAPGSTETLTPAYRDLRSGELSVYNETNNRNLLVRRPFQGVTSSIVSETIGIRGFDHTGRDFGFTNLAARHATRFFRDSTLVSDTDHSNVPRNSFDTTSGPGRADNAFTERPSFHKVHRNNLLKAEKVVNVVTQYEGPALTNLSGAKLPALQNESLYVGRLNVKLIGSGVTDTDKLFRSSSIDSMYDNGFCFSSWFAAEAWDATSRFFMSFGAPQSPEPVTQEVFAIRRGSRSGNNAKLEIVFYLWNGSTGGGASFSELIYETNNHCLEANGNYHHLLVSVAGENGSLGSKFDVDVYVNGAPQAITKTAGTVLNYYSEHDRELWTSVGSRLKAWNGSSGYYLGPLESIIMIGGSSAQTNGNIFSGSLDEVSLWSIPMNSTKVNEIYNGGVPCDLTASATYLSNSTGMVGWWRMGDVENDAVGFNNPGSFILGGNSIVNASGSGVGSITPLATKGSNNSTDLNNDNVLAGCTPTAVQVEVTSHVCRQVYDNLNVYHQIPRSDRQYSWFANSIAHTGACEPRYSGFMQVNSPIAPYYNVTGTLEPFFDYVSGTTTTIDGIYQNTTRLNLLCADPTGSEKNTLGVTVAQDGLKDPVINSLEFNALITRRGDNYGWNWRAFRQQDHPILHREHRENIITAVKNNEIKEFRLPPVSMRGRPIVINMDVDSQNISLKSTNNNEKIYFNDRELNDLTFGSNDQTVTPADELIRTSKQTSAKLNWIHYSETLFPSTRNEFSSGSRERLGYDNKFWRDDRNERTKLEQDFVLAVSPPANTSVNSFGMQVVESAWPLDAPEDFLSTNRGLKADAKFSLAVSGTAGELQNEYVMVKSASAGGGGSGVRFPGALYARKQMLSSPNSVVSPSGFAKTGSLNNTFSDMIKVGAGEAIWEAGTHACINIKSGSEFSTSSYASKPWFDKYEDFREEIQLAARDYSVIPEFRISEHIKDFVKGGLFNKSKFDTFEIPGTTISSSQPNFYKDYSNSDFLREFADIKEKSDLTAKEIKLTCKAAVRFNPYKGFYPAQRAIDLSSQFSSSFASGITANGVQFSDMGSSTLHRNIRPLIQPLFAPGILYNSIKSGIAVDYPVVYNEGKINRINYSGSSTDTENYCLIPKTRNITFSGLIGQNRYDPQKPYWDLRVPFETIINPGKYIDKVQFKDFEPHLSASLNATASLDDSVSDGIYELMAKNFFGQTGDFFLKDSSLTRIESDLIQDGLKFKDGDVFAARLKIRRSHNGQRFYNFDSGSDGTNDSFSINGATSFTTTSAGPSGGTEIGTFSIPQDPAHTASGFRETFTMYSRPSAFGPAVSGRPFDQTTTNYLNAHSKGTLDSLEGYNWAYTPPYYHGESWVDFIFRPEAGKEYSLEDILTDIETVFWRVDPGQQQGVQNPEGEKAYRNERLLIPNGRTTMALGGSGMLVGTQESVPIYGGSVINQNAMQISSSLNLFGVERVPKKRKDKFGNTILNQNELAGKRWIIQPKWETPMLNFADVKEDNNNITYPTNFSESVPRGIWHQFGKIPTDPDTGVFIEIGDIPSNWLRNHYEVINYSSSYNNGDPDASGSNAYTYYQSLTDLFGFQRSQKKDSAKVRLGEIADKRELYEAVVAIPYIIDPIENYQPLKLERNKQLKKFINIPKLRFESALKEREGSITGDSLDIAGDSIRQMVQKMKRYVMPPQFDFINFDEIDPIVMYFFEFKYEFDKDDLSYIWQNLAPRDYKKITFQESSVAHNLMNSELLNEHNLIDNPNLRWMVFKVKQKADKDYYDLVPPQIKAARKLTNLDKIETDKDDEYIQFNWPYDYLSFVELIKLEADVLYKAEDEEPQ